MDPNDEEFWGAGGKPVFLIRTRQRIRERMEQGVREGWWEGFDEKTLTPIPPPKVFKISDFPENATMGHVMVEAGLFPSVNQARKNGWDMPIQPGDWTVTKKKIRIRVVE